MPKVSSTKIAEIAFPSLVWRIPNRSNKIYLTFDDGPIPEITEWVLDVLKSYNIKASFFCVGENVKNNPDVYKRIIDEGHAVGCHTFNHLNGWFTSNEVYLENIITAEKYIKSNIMRPPYGKIRLSLAKLISHSYKIVMWDVLSKDYDPDTTPEECYQNVMDKAGSGSIVVFHDSIKAFRNMKYALPRAIESLLNKGFQFDKISLDLQ